MLTLWLDPRLRRSLLRTSSMRSCANGRTGVPGDRLSPVGIKVELRGNHWNLSAPGYHEQNPRWARSSWGDAWVQLWHPLAMLCEEAGKVFFRMVVVPLLPAFAKFEMFDG